MKCPKCHYLSFEPSPRCRNCGFDLGIAETDLPIRPVDEVEAPLADLDLRPKRRSARRPPKTLGLIHPAREAEAVATMAVADIAMAAPPADSVVPQPERRPVAAVMAAPRPAPSIPVPGPVPDLPPTPGELPLFVKGLASRPAVAPLAVRRPGPELVRARPAPPTPPRPPGPIDADLIEDLARVEAEEAVRARAQAKAEARLEREAIGEAPRRARLAALAADWGILVTLGVLILWGSLRVSGARPSDLGVPALIPLLTFIILVDFAYFLLFTAGNGQTPGKMALSIRVVDATPTAGSRPPSMRQAAYRTLLAALSGLFLGVGFLPALGERGMAAPDRLTRTRTVRA